MADKINTKIGSSGIDIPDYLLKTLGLKVKPGDSVTVSNEDGKMVITPHIPLPQDIRDNMYILMTSVEKYRSEIDWVDYSLLIGKLNELNGLLGKISMKK